jgi:hypothetical protein
VTPGDDRLVAALKAEHAAIYGYGIVGAHVTGAQLVAVDAADAAHRSRRDALLMLLAGRGMQPPGAETAYALPFPVINDATAVKLAAIIEDRCAAFWLRALPDTTDDDRSAALAALSDCAVRGSQWRQFAGRTPATVAFPGLT